MLARSRDLPASVVRSGYFLSTPLQILASKMVSSLQVAVCVHGCVCILAWYVEHASSEANNYSEFFELVKLFIFSLKPREARLQKNRGFHVCGANREIL